MAIDNNKRLADEIMSHVGGVDNIASLNHCSTRLRLKVNDENLFEINNIKKIDGVLDVIKSMGGYQIVVGNNVSKVFKYITENYNVKTDAVGGRIAANPFETVLNVLADVMGPVIPAVVAAGLFSAVATISTLCGLSTESSTYQILYSISQAPFYFLPFLVAYTGARHWKLNPVLTEMIAGVMLYPSFTALVDSGNAITFFGLPVTAVSYASSLIPMILTCWAMYYVNKFIEKIIPDAIRYVGVPFLTILFMVPIALCLTGPVGSWIGSLLGILINFLYSTIPGITIFVIAVLAPFMVLTGSHLALLPIVTNNFTTLGYDNSLLVAFLGINFAMFGVSAAVFLKAKHASLKTTAFSTALTAFLTGTTEPALYGICLRLKKPLIAAFIGCACTGLYLAITHVVIYSFGAPGFFTMANFIDPSGVNTANFGLAIGAAVISIVSSFIATWILGFDESGFEDSDVEKK